MVKPGANKVKNLLIVFIIVFIGLYFRRSDAFTRPQIYAEDGPIFLHQCAFLGLKSLWTPYAGYLLVIPRLIALFFSFLHIDYLYIPLCYCLSCFVLCFGVSWELWQSASHVNIRHKLLYATIFLFIPVGPEMFMNLTNSIWITSLYIANFLFIGYRRYGAEKWKGLKLLLILLVSLTGPYSLLLSPIAVFILWRERKTLSAVQAVPLCIIIACGIIQLVHIKYLAPMDRSIPGVPEPLHFLKFIKYNIQDLVFARKESMFTRVPARAMTIFCLLVFLFLNYLLFKNYLRIQNTGRKYVLLLVPLVYMGSCIAVFWPMETHVLALYCPRYFFVPYTFFAWTFILGMDKVKHIIYEVLYCYYLFSYQSQNMYYNLSDKEWKKNIEEYKAGKRETIDINPDGWSVQLPPYKK